MPGGRGVKKSGRGDGGRGEPSRQSRRVRGLGPEEHKDLETVVRDARKAKKATRESEVAQGRDVEAFAAQDQSAAGSQPQRIKCPLGPKVHRRRILGRRPLKSQRSTPARVVLRRRREAPTGVKPEPVRVKEEAKTLSSKVNSGFAPPEPRISAPSSQVKLESDIREAAMPAPESGAAASDAENMVFSTLGRGEPGKVTPPSVVYEWPTPKPDVNSYFAAAYATGNYFKWRLSLVNQDEAWISEFYVARWGVGTAQDLMATTIPQSIMTARECVAILQTLFFEADFEFVNLIPSWSTTRYSRIPESLVRSVMEEVQNFIAVELVEWRMVIAGVSFKLNSEDHAAPSVQEQVPRLEYHKEDGDGNLLMTDYNADLLGRQFVLRFRVTGLRISRSPRGSSDGEPQSKRSQHGPPRPQVPSTPSALSTPSLSSLPAYKSSTSISLQNSTPLNSMSNGRESLEMEAQDAVPDLVSSVIGTSRASDESTASGAQTSYGSSSSSSMRSLGQQVGALALVAQSASGFTATVDLGFQATRTVIPHSHVAVDQADVEMESSVRSDPEIAPRKTGLPGISAATAEPKLRVSSPGSGFDGARDVGGDERSQHQRSKSETHSRRSTRSRKSATSSRSSASRQLGSALSVSSRSGPAQIELNVLRQQRNASSSPENAWMPWSGQRDLDARRQIQELTDRLRSPGEKRNDERKMWKFIKPRVPPKLRVRPRMSWKLCVSSASAWMPPTLSTGNSAKPKRIQRFHAGQVGDLRATLAQVQGRRATVTPDLATNVRSSAAQNPEIATDFKNPMVGTAIVAGQRQGTADLKNTPEIADSQRRATVVQPSADTSGRGKHVKRGHGAPETKVMQDVKCEPVPVGKSSDPRRITVSKASRGSKTDSKRSVSKKHRQENKKRRDVNPPSDSDPSSDSSDDDSSSESSDDSSDENPGVDLTAASATQAGTTLLTF
ncbi:LOW QUALITY PROTEIN: Hypothetical protein PHPALM_15360 [Phytophthora palmivora]|uniref:Uncharacterized protein n=1 Tax=Phytophthora palmivora TaxID=4796 RepID=A0A2P4XSF5_9STRA|nr:LOW QUALITY PROTEIN: Hypothetical protein PHPALM_15360 [Phytophthora palmivora]